MMTERKKFNLTRVEGVRIIEKITDNDDPYWADIVEDFYDEDTDSMPSIFDVLRAIGITRNEYIGATGIDNLSETDWPTK